MSFLWPGVLWGLLLLPALAGLYVWLRRHPVRHAVRYPGGDILAAAARRAGRRQHVTAGLFLLGVGAVVVALGRPVLPLPTPSEGVVVLSIDVSGSMRSEDIKPTRMEAAKEAARVFVQALPPRIRLGLVVFGGYAMLAVSPTVERARVLEAIAQAGFVRRTAIGEGLLEAVRALPPRAAGPDAQAVHERTAIILLSDGVSNTGIDPLEAAEQARARGAVVYTVGVGSSDPYSMGYRVGGPLDDRTLRAIADVTGGAYYHATSAEGLRSVYRRLAGTIGWERRPQEVSGVLAALAAAALVAALVLARLGSYRLA